MKAVDPRVPPAGLINRASHRWGVAAPISKSCLIGWKPSAASEGDRERMELHPQDSTESTAPQVPRGKKVPIGNTPTGTGQGTNAASGPSPAEY